MGEGQRVGGQWSGAGVGGGDAQGECAAVVVADGGSVCGSRMVCPAARAAAAAVLRRSAWWPSRLPRSGLRDRRCGIATAGRRRIRRARPQGNAGKTTDWSSPQHTKLPKMTPMSDASSQQPVWSLPSGPHASSGAASSRSCPTTACPSNRSHAWAGTSGTSVTELVYRKQIRPVVENGAVTMDRLFPTSPPVND